MGSNKGKSKQSRQRRQHKKSTAVTFDPEERSNYLKGMIGCKKRRRQFYFKKVEREQKEAKKQDRSDHRAERKDQLRKAKELLEQLTERVEDNYRSIHQQKAKVEVNEANKILVQTKFY